MNNITNITESLSAIKPQKNAPKLKNTDSFKNILNSAMEEKEISSSAINDLNIIQKTQKSFGEIDITKSTYKLLDMLDDYSNKLKDTNNSLRDIEPLINTIKNSAERLVHNSNETLSAENSLKDIVTQCAITANKEYLKFNRGDYL